ncbi:lectin [Xanthomonas sp. AmX2]|uniref:lectin n=1 Tax=Xanthomonas sp. TaxID=29446 RepID=UPI0019817A1E|nr:lectin [Xanthomonas sp.]MBN6151817.1 lectin [Xanthomonas sp.]
MKPKLPATAMLLLALCACGRQETPPPAPASGGQADALPPPPIDQPDGDVPPAQAPAGAMPPEMARADRTLAQFDGYGDVRFGMSAEQARRAWGGELDGKPGEAGGCYYLTPKWAQGTQDFGFMVEGDKLVRYDVGHPKETAPGGGKVGMRAEELRQRYAGRIEEQPHKYVEGAKLLRIRSDAGQPGVLVFELDATGTATAWRVGVPPQVDYVERCS